MLLTISNSTGINCCSDKLIKLLVCLGLSFDSTKPWTPSRRDVISSYTFSSVSRFDFCYCRILAKRESDHLFSVLVSFALYCDVLGCKRLPTVVGTLHEVAIILINQVHWNLLEVFLITRFYAKQVFCKSRWITNGRYTCYGATLHIWSTSEIVSVVCHPKYF